jgi:DNA polymerase
VTSLPALLAEMRAVGHYLKLDDADEVILRPAPGAKLDLELIARLRPHKAALQRMLLTAYIDFETYSTLDLTKVGARTYAEHASTEVLCLAYAVGLDPPAVWTPFDAEHDEDGFPQMPQALFAALILPEVRFVAHNISFDRVMWEMLGWPMPPFERWSCTAFRSRVARLPAELEEAAKVLNLPHKKDAAGKKLMRSLTSGVNPYEHATDEQWQQFYDYSATDIEVARDLDLVLPEMPEDWRPLFELDDLMNSRGFPVDLEAVQKLVVVRDHEDARLKEEFERLSGGELTTPDQVAKLKALIARHGVDLPDLQRSTLTDWIAANPRRNDLAARLIRNRRDWSHAADAKLGHILATAADCSSVRDTFILHGAHSGRWAGRGTQLQNLPKITIDDPETMLVRLMERADGIIAGTVDPKIDADWPVSIKEAIGNCLRPVFKALEGEVFVACDLSQIEARVLAWIAGQDNKLDLYRAGQDVYIYEARNLGSDNRELGKLFELSCGYGASGRVIHSRAPKFGVIISQEYAYELTDRWRENNAAIVTFWHELFDHIELCLELPTDGRPLTYRCFNIWRDAEMLFLQLPCGRCLKYPKAELQIGRYGALIVAAQVPERKKLRTLSAWHGTFAENVTQAIAYDILVEKMLELHRRDVRLIGSIHDEAIALAKLEDAERVRDLMIEVMQTPPVWAPDLPLVAEAFVNTRFVKPTKRPTHAPLAPSSADRWMHCPGSIAAEALAGPQPEQSFTTEGNEAHKVFAACLERDRDPAEMIGDPRVLPFMQHALLIARDVIAGRRFKVEVRLDSLPGLAKVWGTADVLVFDQHDRIVDVLDLKFGAGVPVEPDAIQVRIYALLAAQMYGCPLEGIDLHIVQPRRAHTAGPHRTHHVSTHDLDCLFARLQEAVGAVENPAAPRVAGDWCQFCSARPGCPEARSRPRPARINPFLAWSGHAHTR